MRASTPRVAGGETALTVEDVALAGATYEKDYDLQGATLRQCADEIHVVLQAMENGCNSSLVATSLMGIAGRMVMAARIEEEAP